MTKPTFDKLEGEVFMHDHKIEDITDLTSPFQYKGGITVAADFPTLALVQNGWTYTILADVTDNNATKTNTGQSFLSSDEIAWNGTNWTTLGNNDDFLKLNQATPQTIINGLPNFYGGIKLADETYQGWSIAYDYDVQEIVITSKSGNIVFLDSIVSYSPYNYVTTDYYDTDFNGCGFAFSFNTDKAVFYNNGAVDSFEFEVPISASNLSGTNTGDNSVNSSCLAIDQTTPQTITANDTTITASDELYFGDVTDSTKIKKDTVQGLLDLMPTPKPDTYYGTSSTAGGTQIKAVTTADTTFTSLTAKVGDILMVRFTAGNSNVVRIRLNGEAGAPYARLENANFNSIFPADSAITLVWDGTYWQVVGVKPPVETNQFGSYAMSTQAVGATTYGYKVVMEAPNGDLYPILTTHSTGTKTISSVGFILGGTMLLNVGGGTYNAGTSLSQDFVTFGRNPSTSYSLNSVTGFSLGNPIYLKGTVSTTDGLFYLDRSSANAFYTQTLPTTEDGFVYILLGIYGGGAWFFNQDHPIYYFKDGLLRVYGTKENTRTDNFKEYFGNDNDEYIEYDPTLDGLQTAGKFKASEVRGVHKASDGTAPVADGTYVVGIGTTTNGKITIKDGIITSIEEAT